MLWEKDFGMFKETDEERNRIEKIHFHISGHPILMYMFVNSPLFCSLYITNAVNEVVNLI